jgi:hypothetical protein
MNAATAQKPSASIQVRIVDREWIEAHDQPYAVHLVPRVLSVAGKNNPRPQNEQGAAVE